MLPFCPGLASLCLLILGAASAQTTNPISTDLPRMIWVNTEDGARTHGELVEAPAANRKPVGLVYIHPRSNHGFFMQGPLAKAGYSSFAMVARHNTDLTMAMWEDLPLDLAAGVKYMLAHGYQQVALLGISSSAPVLSGYQDLAENADERAHWYPGKSYTFPKSAGLILLNPTPGHSTTYLRRIDPSIIDELTGRKDPSLDMYNPKNWIAGDSKTYIGVRYSPEFLARYRKAQSARLNRLMDAARARLKLIDEGKGRFNDDDMFVFKGIWANPYYLDLTLGATKDSAARADPAVGTNGAGERPIRLLVKENNELKSSEVHSLRSFLSFRAIRSTDPYMNFDVSTSNGVGTYHLGRINAPILFGIATGDEQVYLSDMDENIASIKKSTEWSRFFVKGASHGFGPKPEYRQQAVQGVLDWLQKKFPIN